MLGPVQTLVREFEFMITGLTPATFTAMPDPSQKMETTRPKTLMILTPRHVRGQGGLKVLNSI